MFNRQVFKLLFLILLLSLFFMPSSLANNVPVAKNGVIDLQEWSLSEDGPISLQGKWFFYWEQLFTPQNINTNAQHEIEVPSQWSSQEIDDKQLTNQGYGTYVLTIYLHPNDVNETLALVIPSIATSYQLWIDGKVVENHGVVGTNRESMVPQNYTKPIYFTPNQDEVELVLHVSNFVQRKGGVWESITIGRANDISLLREKAIMEQITVAGGLLIISMYHIVFYLYRKKNLAILFFGMACLLLMMRILLTGDVLLIRLWPSINWELAVKMEYMTASLGIGFLLLFAYNIYKEDFQEKVVKLLFIALCVINVPVLLFKAIIYTQMIKVYQAMLLIAGCYIVFGLVIAAYKKRRGAIIHLIVLFIFFISVFLETLYYNFVIDRSGMLPVGFLIFALALILAARLSTDFMQIEKMSKQLQETNKQLEEKVKQRTKEIRNLMTNIAHDLGTPLTSILGYLGAMKEGVFDKNKDQYLNIVYSKAQLLKKLSDDLKRVVKHDAEQFSYSFKNLEVQAFIDEMYTKYSEDAKREGVHFYKNNKVNAVIFADRFRLEQMMMNIITNAINHTPQEGSITICSRLFPKVNKVVLIVKDTGSGIPKEDIPFIFERYYKGKSLKQDVGGAGLGLAISKEIIQNHGGRIGVISKEGTGSTFFVILPTKFENRRQNQ